METPEQNETTGDGCNVRSSDLLGSGGAYYRNSLLAWKERLQRDLRISMSRYASLERQGHPCLRAQGKLIELQRNVLKMVDQELRPNGEA